MEIGASEPREEVHPMHKVQDGVLGAVVDRAAHCFTDPVWSFGCSNEDLRSVRKFSVVAM